MIQFQTFGIVGRDDPANFKALSMEEAEQFARDCYSGHKSDFRSYLPEIIPLIEEVEKKEGCAYNRSVEALAHERLFPQLAEELDSAHQSRYLSLLVYNTQCYRRSVEMYAGQVAFERDMIEQGFTMVEDVKAAIQTGKRYFVAEASRPTPEKLLAVQFGEKSVLWATRRNSRRGFYAQTGQWIKAA